jgi:hypothetical protein
MTAALENGKVARWEAIRAQFAADAAQKALDASMQEAKTAKDTAIRTALGPPYTKLSATLAQRTETEWLLRDILEAGVIALVIGGKGTYKSTLVNDWAMRVAVFLKQPVFILSPEGSGLQRRLQGWLDHFAPFTDVNEVPLYTRDRRVNISVGAELDALISWLDEIEKSEGKEPALICIDTWSKATGHDEDNNTETKKLVGELDRRIKHRRAKRCAVIVVHHAGHGDQTRGRGASSLGADTDAEYIVSKTKAGPIKMTRERFKDAPSLPPLFYAPQVLKLGYKDKEGFDVTSVVLAEAEAPKSAAEERLTKKQGEIVAQVKALAASGTPATEKAIIDGIDGRGPDLKRRLTGLIGKVLSFDGTVYAIDEGSIQLPDDEVFA